MIQLTQAQLQAICPHMVDGEKCGADVLIQATFNHYDGWRVRWRIWSPRGWRDHIHQPNHEYEYANAEEPSA